MIPQSCDINSQQAFFGSPLYGSGNSFGNNVTGDDRFCSACALEQPSYQNETPQHSQIIYQVPMPCQRPVQLVFQNFGKVQKKTKCAS